MVKKEKKMRVREMAEVEKSPENIKEEEEEGKDELLCLSKLFKIRGGSTSPKPSLSMVVDDHAEESTSGNRALINEDKAMPPALDRAHEVRDSLNLKFPNFVKSMLHSHVTRGFWLGLPTKFCNVYLPKEDIEITLVDENKEEYTTKYLSTKQGLSAGWRGFSIAHGLVEGDALIFHLVKATKFEVIILKACNSGDLKPLTQLKKTDSRKHIKTGKKSEGRRPRTIKLAALQPPVENLENGSGEDTSEVLEGIKLSQIAIKFEDIIKGQASFSVIVNGLNIDSELSEYTRSKYNELCYRQNAFLHDKLLEGMNCKLVAGIISETVNIADAIKASKLSSSSNEFSSWDTCLGAFEQMGMNVAFLRAQLQRLLGAAKESKEMAKPKKHCKLRGVERADSESKKKGNSKKCSKLSSSDTLDLKICRELRGQDALESETCREPETLESKMCHGDMDELAHVEEDIRNLRSQIMELKKPSKRSKS